MAVDTARETIERFKNTAYGPYTTVSMHDEFKGVADYMSYDENTDVNDDAQLRELFGFAGVDMVYVSEFREWYEAQLAYAAFLASMGAEYLDTHYSDWRDKVDEQRLSMASGTHCILGQVFGDYEDGIRRIFAERVESEGDPGDWDVGKSSMAREFGFIDNGACYLALDYAWQDELRKRR